MGSCFGKPEQTEKEQVVAKLRKLYSQYAKHLLPLERSSHFSSLGDPPYTEADVLAPLMVLTIGQYSTGKTTFIRALLGRDYPGMHISAAPATDKFFAILEEEKDDEIPGTSLVNNTSQPFTSLKASFSDNFLQNFHGATMRSRGEGDILEDLIVIDSPGTLDSDGGRNYNYPGAMGWFARRAALIVIFFDVNKMGVSREMTQVLDSIQGNEEKIRIVFNKADTVPVMDLTDSLSGLQFNLAKSMPTPEVPKVYVTSLDSLAHEYKGSSQEHHDRFARDKEHLLQDIDRVRHNTYSRKINLLDKRARMVRNHAYVMMQLEKEKKKCVSMIRPKLKDKDKEQLVKRVPSIYEQVQKEQNRATGEFLSASSLQEKLAHHDLDRLPSLSRAQVEKAYRKMEQALQA